MNSPIIFDNCDRLSLETSSEIDSIVTVAVGSCFCKSEVADLIAALAEAAVDATLAPEMDPAMLPSSESVSESSSPIAVAALALCLAF